MELTGTVFDILAEVGGTGKNGNAWRKKEFVLEVPSQFPKKVCISMWGDRIDQFTFQKGEAVTASIDVESREYNGRWFTEVRAWKVERAGASAPAPGASGFNAAVPPVTTFSADSQDDLPF